MNSKILVIPMLSNSLSALHFYGKDAATFLNGQLSIEVKAEQKLNASYYSYNTPQGRVIANGLIHEQAGEYYLLLHRDLAADTCMRLRKYILRSKLNIQAVNLQVLPSVQDSTFTITDSLSDQIWHFRVDEAKNPESSAAEYNFWLTQIKHGVPWVNSFTTEQYVAQMINLDLIGAIDFKKGCYVGQEIIARLYYRGKNKRRTVLLYGSLHNEHISTLQELSDETEQKVGEICASASDEKDNWYLGCIRLDKINAVSTQDGCLIISQTNQKLTYKDIATYKIPELAG